MSFFPVFFFALRFHVFINKNAMRLNFQLIFKTVCTMRSSSNDCVLFRLLLFLTSKRKFFSFCVLMLLFRQSCWLKTLNNLLNASFLCFIFVSLIQYALFRTPLHSKANLFLKRSKMPENEIKMIRIFPRNLISLGVFYFIFTLSQVDVCSMCLFY